MSEVDFIFPCYNPPAGWAEGLLVSTAKIQKLLPDVKFNYVIVDDGSANSEKLGVELDFLKSKLPSLRVERYRTNRGKGYALRHGIRLAQAPICIFTDIDCPYHEESVAALCRELLKGYDIVPGRRARDYYEKVRLDRVVISRVLRLILRLMFRLNVSDTQCGLKGFNSRGKALFLTTQIDRYLFDLEFLCLAAQDRTLKVVPCNVRLKDGIVMSKFGLRVLLHELWDFFKIWIGTFGRSR